MHPDSHYTDPAHPVFLPLANPGETTTIDDAGSLIRRSILPGGVRLITQEVPGALSVAISLGVAVGSRDETPQEGGISHFLEHLLFKGTRARSAFQIAQSFDKVGAESNASTAKESTFYWAHMVADDLPRLLPVLVDMVSDSIIAEEDVKVEMGVILDELAMSEDTPHEVVSEAFARAVYGDSGLGRPVGGTTESVRSQSAKTIRRLYLDRYRPDTLVVSAAGSVDHDELADQLNALLSGSSWGGQLGSSTPPAPRRQGTWLRQDGAPATIVLERDVEQALIISGGPWLPALDPGMYASAVTLNVLGGGMSSRLFQEIRERRGLAYSTYAFAGAHVGAGQFGLFAGCSPAHIGEVRDVMWAEVEKLAAHGPTEEELARVKGQVRGATTLRLEEMTSRMWRLAEAELMGQIVTVTDAIARIDGVEARDVQEMAARMVAAPRREAVVTAK